MMTTVREHITSEQHVCMDGVFLGAFSTARATHFDLDLPSSTQELECDRYFFSATSDQGLLATLLYLLNPSARKIPFSLVHYSYQSFGPYYAVRDAWLDARRL